MAEGPDRSVAACGAINADGSINWTVIDDITNKVVSNRMPGIFVSRSARLEAAVRYFRRIAAERMIHYREEEMPNAERAWQEIVDYADAALKEDA